MEKSQKEIIKDICKEFECTQKELADKLGISVSAVYKWTDNQTKIPNSFYKTINFIREIYKLNKELSEKYKK